MSLRKNFSWTLLGNIIYSVCQWGMLSVLAKLGSPDMVGRFALGLAITAPIIMFSMLQLRALQATDAKFEYEFGHYLALRLVTSALALVIIAVVTYLSGFRGEVALVILTVGLLKAIESISDAYQGLMQQHERMDRIAFVLMIKGPLFLLALTVIIYFTHNLAWGVAALVLVSLLVLLSYEKINARWLLKSYHYSAIHPAWQWGRLARLAWLSLPMGVVMMLISLNANIPRYFIERILGERALGYFAAMAYLLVAGNTIISALGQSASPRLALYYASGQRGEFLRLLRRMVSIGALLGLGGVTIALLFGRQILTLLYRPDYAQHVNTFVWIAIASSITFVASFFGYGMTATRMFRSQLPPNIVAIATVTAACFFLVPAYGLTGAAMAITLGAFNKFLSTGFFLLKAVRCLECSKEKELPRVPLVDHQETFELSDQSL